MIFCIQPQNFLKFHLSSDVPLLAPSEVDYFLSLREVGLIRGWMKFCIGKILKKDLGADLFLVRPGPAENLSDSESGFSIFQLDFPH